MAWTVKSSEYARQWDLFYSLNEDAIYHHTAFDYSIHRKLRYDYDKETEEFCDMLPIDAIPIDRHETAHTWIWPSCLPTQDLLPDNDEPITVHAIIDTLPPWERLLFTRNSFSPS